MQRARLTAWEIVQEDISVTLITDDMAGHLMSNGEIDAVIVGTERGCSIGDVANNMGTYTVAVLAARHKIPFFAVCPSSTIDLALPMVAAIPIGERAAAEVTGFREAKSTSQAVKVRNPSLDVAPADLVTAIVTEKGVIQLPYPSGVKALFEEGKAT